MVCRTHCAIPVATTTRHARTDSQTACLPSVGAAAKKDLSTSRGSFRTNSVYVCDQTELVHAAAARANIRSILVAMMKSFSCSPLIFLVCRETVALPQPKQIFG